MESLLRKARKTTSLFNSLTHSRRLNHCEIVFHLWFLSEDCLYPQPSLMMPGWGLLKRKMGQWTPYKPNTSANTYQISRRVLGSLDKQAAASVTSVTKNKRGFSAEDHQNITKVTPNKESRDRSIADTRKISEMAWENCDKEGRMAEWWGCWILMRWPGFKSRSVRYLLLFRVTALFNSLVILVNSQVICFLPVWTLIVLSL